ncbi:hypothetical protein [Aeromonas caviae]|uniref:hypothetical protein n=1 Tax=Aeromonas caviae TaxID=648 RepID=UPI0039F5038C
MKLKLELENCYGINKLLADFNLEKTAKNNGVNSVYAPNGTLKTSLAKTFKDIESDKVTTDLIFTERRTKRNISIDGADIDKSQVMVIDSYNESYSSKQLSTLLVNDALKQQYEQALMEVDDKRSALIKALAKISGKKNTPELICESFGRQEKDLLELLSELHQQNYQDFSSLQAFKHDQLFNPKVLELVSSGNFSQELAEYVDTYDKLIQQSTVLSKTFNHQKADDVSKNLSSSGFFKASHSVNLSINGDKQEVTSEEQLQNLLQTEQDKVFKSAELKDKFNKVDAKLKTRDTQTFRDFIAEHQELLPNYQNVSLFKKYVIIGYLQSQQNTWDDLVSIYKKNQKVVAEIVKKAQEEKTTWERVVDTFNKRFSVPFKLRVDNQDEVILNDAAPTIKFDFNDGRGNAEQINQQSLIAALSQGEKRALYILNVLFEVEIRKSIAHPLLVIIDDIADSFDYKNKYAIVEYLQDIAQDPHFHLLLLTHNFDFHRIVSSRLDVSRQNRKVAVKTTNEIKILIEKYKNDVFKTWKQEFHKNVDYMLASIPFVRNIADYCGHDAYFLKLTSLLHLKRDTKDIKVRDLQTIYSSVLVDLNGLVLPDGDALVIDKIMTQSDRLVAANHESPDLESKVILAMAIRLKSEEYMINKIADHAFVEAIDSNQTRQLFQRYVSDFSGESEAISLLDEVNLMTPENIHLNSFMYEPILDMSASSLYRLYGDIKQFEAPLVF